MRPTLSPIMMALTLVPGLTIHALAARRIGSPDEIEHVENSWYWIDRRVVALRLECDSSGVVRHSFLIENHGSQHQADSLLDLVHVWKVPHRSWRPTSDGFLEVATFALNRSGQGQMAHPLPIAYRERFDADPLREWIQALRAADPATSLDDFITYGPYILDPAPAPGALHDPRMRQKREFGMLADSPTGDFVLDPFEGIDVTDSGTLVPDVDTGFSVFERQSGDRRCYWVGTREGIAMVGWLEPAKFVLVGTALVEYPIKHDLWRDIDVPAIWIGDVEECRLTRYIGNPLAPQQWAAYRARIQQARKQIYPRIHTSD